MFLANLNEDFGLKKLVNKSGYCRLLSANSVEGECERCRQLTAVELGICKQFDKVTTVSRFHKVT